MTFCHKQHDLVIAIEEIYSFRERNKNAIADKPN